MNLPDGAIHPQQRVYFSVNDQMKAKLAAQNQNLVDSPDLQVMGMPPQFVYRAVVPMNLQKCAAGRLTMHTPFV